MLSALPTRFRFAAAIALIASFGANGIPQIAHANPHEIGTIYPMSHTFSFSDGNKLFGTSGLSPSELLSSAKTWHEIRTQQQGYQAYNGAYPYTYTPAECNDIGNNIRQTDGSLTPTSDPRHFIYCVSTITWTIGGNKVSEVYGFNWEYSSGPKALKASTCLAASKGQGADDGKRGNPCDAATGNKFLREVDYTGGNGVPTFARYLSTQDPVSGSLGSYWRFDDDRRLVHVPAENAALVTRPNSATFIFRLANNIWSPDGDVTDRLEQTPSGWTYTLRDGRRETYDANGRLLTETDAQNRTTTYTYNTNGRLATVTGPFGHSLTLAYNGYQLIRVTDPNGQTINYTYDNTNRLIKVTYPDNTARRYHYESPHVNYPHLITGISLDNGAGQVRRLSTYAYDSNGKAILTQHADVGNGGPQEKYSFVYNSATQTTVTNAAGTTEVLTFAETLGVKNLVNKAWPDGKTLNQTFDANNNLTCKKDEEGRVTTYTYNAANQRTGMTEGQGGTCAAPTQTTATRTTTYQYVSTTLDAPTVIESPSVATGQVRRTTLTYADTRFPTLPTSITQSGFTPAGSAVTRTVAITYSAQGQVLTLDGPRTDVNDVTTFTYYDCTTGGACGQLKTVTNALNQTTTYNSYDAHGRVTEMTDPNGLKTNYAYDLRGRVLSVTQTPSGGTSRTTQYAWDDNSNVTEVTDPTGRKLTYTYDNAQYLRTVTDNLGNKVAYSYDTRGNRTQEDVTDSSNTLVRTITTAYDIRNRISQINAGGSVTTLVHNAVGDLTQSTSPNQQGQATPKSTTYTYDALSRLTQTVDTLGGTTTLAHTPTDSPQSVTAPNAANTAYTHDDLGRRLTETSPDRGTITYTNDPAGNVLTLTDARGVTVTYTYDALHRPTKTTYSTDPSLTVTYTYDTGTGCTNSIGRLCQVTDASGTTNYAYDAYGNVTEHKKTELGVAYSTKYTYDNADRILTITYPDNRTLTYTRDILGRLTQASFPVNGTPTVLTQNRTWRADGLLSTQTLGSGLTESKTYDQQGRMTQWVIGGETRTYTYDANSNVQTRTTPADSRTYVYDPEDRLTEDRITAGTGTTQTLVYDLNGNRTKLNTTAYLYTANSNRLTKVGTKTLTLDPAGNTTKDNLNYNYTYDAAGRLREARSGTTLKGTYTYNHRHLRTRKVAGSTTTVYHYDLDGRLIAETTNTGTLIRAYVHDDEAPIAQVTKTTTDTLAYVHADHLGTPRLATNPARSTVWRYDGNAFGDTAPTGSITVNLRFPGQYYDTETKLHYNWHRYYDPRLGRYVTSDPIGLEGGMNTYAYVNSNPLMASDPEGLDAIVVRNSTATYYGPKGEILLSIPIVSGVPKVRDPRVMGLGPTPPGVYTIEEPPSTTNDKLFCVGKECWYVPYIPQFTTPNKRCLPPPAGTGTCGIHPANYGQTAGCTGIPSAKDAAKMRDLIRQFKPSRKNPLPVLVGK